MSWDSGLNKKEKGSNTNVDSSLTPNCPYKVTSCFLLFILLLFVYKNACGIKRKGENVQTAIKIVSK